MNINIQIREAHAIITDDKGEIALSYSINCVDMDLNVPLAIKLFGGVMKQVMTMQFDEVDAPAYKTAAERGFTTAQPKSYQFGDFETA